MITEQEKYNFMLEQFDYCIRLLNDCVNRGALSPYGSGTVSEAFGIAKNMAQDIQDRRADIVRLSGKVMQLDNYLEDTAAKTERYRKSLERIRDNCTPKDKCVCDIAGEALEQKP